MCPLQRGSTVLLPLNLYKGQIPRSPCGLYKEVPLYVLIKDSFQCPNESIERFNHGQGYGMLLPSYFFILMLELITHFVFVHWIINIFD